jgi:TrmH family RNA methyltransferase
MNLRLKRYRKSFEYSYANGVFATLELLDAQPEHVLRVVLSSKSERNVGIAKLKDLCARNRVPVETNDKTIERLSPKGSHLAIGVFRKYRSRLDPTRNHVVLVHPGDMGNVGTIARTMVGFRITDLALIRPAVDIFDPRTVRASMGAVFRLSLEYFDHFEDYSHSFAHNLYPLMTNGRVAIACVRFKPPFALVFGNESSGLTDEFLTVGTSVAIPHDERIDSLNLSAAVAIALYESTKLTAFAETTRPSGSSK